MDKIMKAKRELTPKQERFVDEYMIDLNATQAAIRAGYSERTAYSIGQRLLKHVEIASRIQERKAALSIKTKLTQEWVLEQLNLIVQKSSMEEEVQKWDYENKCMTGTGRFIYDSKGANKALELIGKHLGMYKTDINFNGTLGVKIIDDIKEDDQLTIDVEKIE